MIERLPVQFNADHRKVALLYFKISSERITALVARIQQLDKKEVSNIMEETEYLYGLRHRNLREQMYRNAETAVASCKHDICIDGDHKVVLGAYLTKEYATQAAALFNPTIVPHPNQSGVATDALRFVICLRSTGEGHISSITFRQGLITSDSKIKMEDDHSWQSLGHVTRAQSSDEAYTVNFDPGIPLQERILFPVTPHEVMGMEDLRMVSIEDPAGNKYVGTFTAYDGKHIRSKLLMTTDFYSFDIAPLKGRSAVGKGIAIFPRKIKGKYVATGRQDGVNMTIMQSPDLTQWDSHTHLQSPSQPFELTQLGNCGSPIETDEGWLLLTHAVGPMRRYVLGATLLDLEEPHKIIGRLDNPLMQPTEFEREGYVPNVLYTCGWLRHGKSIYLPYAYSDQGCSFARIRIDDLLMALKK